MSRLPVEERFWSKVTKGDGCWNWTGSKNPKGYGRVRHKGQMWNAHRLAWILSGKGDIGKFHVLHRCDNRACVNPEHLELGTIAENSRQMVERGRSVQGVRQVCAKLDDDKVRTIRRMAATTTRTALADRFGVTHSIVSEIISGKRWKHVV